MSANPRISVHPKISAYPKLRKSNKCPVRKSSVKSMLLAYWGKLVEGTVNLHIESRGLGVISIL